MKKTVPKWFDLKEASEYLTNENLTIADLLEFGVTGELPMYAIVPDDCFIQYWDIWSNLPNFIEEEIKNFLLIQPHQIEKIQKMGSATGYSILVEASLPEGYSYELSEYLNEDMRKFSENFSRGVTIKSREAVRILGKDLEDFLLNILAKSNAPIEASMVRAIVNNCFVKKMHYMDSPIKKAKEIAINPNDVSELWGLLFSNAESDTRWSPITDVHANGKSIICHDNTFTKEALRSYLNKRKI